MKRILKRAFIEQRSTLYRKTNNFLALLTIVSIVSLVLETVSSLHEYQNIFVLIEWVAVAFFTLEYVSRLVVTRPYYRYPVSFFGIVDLVSILPTFFGLGNFTFLKSARILRIMRLLRMLRLAKMARVKVVSEESLGALSFNVLIYLVTLLSALLVTGTAMYLVEPDLFAFMGIPGGMWWSFKVFMAGIPVVEPTTELGELFFVLTRFVGLLLLGLLVGVVGNIYTSVMSGKGK